MGKPVPPRPASRAKSIQLTNPSQHRDVGSAVNDAIVNITNLQNSIKAFANAVSSSIGWSNLKNDQTNMTETSKTLHRDSFNDFIAQHYAGVVDEAGMEFDPDPNKKTLEQKTPTKLNKMNTILDTVSRIGSTNSELKADGKWDFRTSNAVKNVYAIAVGVLNLASDILSDSDLKNQLGGYTTKNLADFKKYIDLIPTNGKIDIVVASNLAKAITPHIVKLTEIYYNLKKKIFERPIYKSYIEGTQAFSTIKSNKPALDSDEDAIYNDLKTNKLNSQYATPSTFDIMINGHQYFLNLSDLVDEDSLTAWKNKSKLNNINDLQLLDLIKKALETKSFETIDKNKGWNTFNPNYKPGQ